MTDDHVVELVITMELAYCSDMISKGYPTYISSAAFQQIFCTSLYFLLISCALYVVSTQLFPAEHHLVLSLVETYTKKFTSITFSL